MNKFHTFLTVSGPNAATAEKAAIEAIKSAPKGSLGYRAGWVDAETEQGPHFFDGDSGEGAILAIAKLSGQFSTETFCLNVTGCCDEGPLGQVKIVNGWVEDRRTRIYAVSE
jgi:hypothetical protein